MVATIDPRSSKVVAEVEAHPGGVTSMWADGQLLVTAGLTFKQDMHVPDNALRLYDLRTMKMIMPWPIPLGSSAVKISSWPKRIIYALCPLSYQIASVHLDCEPLVRQIIPVSRMVLHAVHGPEFPCEYSCRKMMMFSALTLRRIVVCWPMARCRAWSTLLAAMESRTRPRGRPATTLLAFLIPERATRWSREASHRLDPPIGSEMIATGAARGR